MVKSPTKDLRASSFHSIPLIQDQDCFISFNKKSILILRLLSATTPQNVQYQHN